MTLNRIPKGDPCFNILHVFIFKSRGRFFISLLNGYNRGVKYSKKSRTPSFEKKNNNKKITRKIKKVYI